MGWIEGQLGSSRTVSHSGSTTDMASVVYLAPERQMGLVVLLNAQSVVYELLHKPEAIAEAAFAHMLGEPVGGTLVGLLPSLHCVDLILLAFQLLFLVRVVRSGTRGEPVVRPFFGRRRLGVLGAALGRLVLPALVLWTTPDGLGGPWGILVQIDLGQVLAAYASLQLLTLGAMVASVSRGSARHGRRRCSRWRNP